MELDGFDPNGVGVDNGTYYGLPFTPEQARLVRRSAPGASTALSLIHI